MIVIVKCERQYILPNYYKGIFKMPQEQFTLTSGREITIDYDESGEPLNVSWMAGQQLVLLSENEVFEIVDFLEDDDDSKN